MPEIQPFKAWRYDSALAYDLLSLTAPLSETLSQQREARLYEYPYHNFHISSPRDVPPFERVQQRVEVWKQKHIIRQDALPTLYAYFQYFSLKGSKKQYVRKGFIAQVKVDAPQAKPIILPHEMTVPKAVAYRTQLLHYTRLHTVPTHLFYTDKELLLESYLQESIRKPIYQLTDSQGTQHVLSAIHDYQVIKHFQHTLRPLSAIIADGHHRYASSQKYAFGQGTNNSPYHLAWFTNTASSDIGLLPTHRILRFLYDFNENIFLDTLQHYFSLKALKSVAELDFVEKWTFGLFLKDKIWQIQLKPQAITYYSANQPDAVKHLDLSVLHHFVLEKCLQIPENQQFNYLDFSQDALSCIREVQAGRAMMALLTKPVRFEQIQEVCEQGFLMPAKTTYFYPKVLSGLLFADA